MPATPGWLAAVEALLDRGIRSSNQATALLRRLEGTALRIDVTGVADVRASIDSGRLALISTDSDAESQGAPVDAVISGSPFALLQLARGSRHRESGRPPGGARTEVSGDAEIANSYRQLFAAAAPDLEEELSRIVGDFPARRLALLAKQGIAWASNTRRTVRENLAEYLQEESRDLVGKQELDEFFHGVDALREAADRVEARLAHLERRLKGSL